MRQAKKPVFRHSAPESIETPRLTMASMRPAYAGAVDALLRISIAELDPYLPFVSKRIAEKPTSAWEKARSRDFADRITFVYGIFLRDQPEMNEARAGVAADAPGRLIGVMEIGRLFNRDDPIAEIGFWLGTPFTGRGHMTEAARAVCEMAFESLKLPSVQLRCDERNVGSQKIAKRLGFAPTHRIVNECVDHHGFMRNTLVYTLGRIPGPQVDITARGNSWCIGR